MNIKTLIHTLTDAIPKTAEWARGEPYGPYNTDSVSSVRKILYCVTPTGEVVEFFKKNNYDVLISHHPMIVGVPQLIFHTALDCCDGGLNDQWRDALQLKNARHFDGTLGWFGSISPTHIEDLVAAAEKFMGQKVIGQIYAKHLLIKSVVICTGLGGMVTDLARKTGADCYLLGEACEPAAEMGFNAVIETGHTRSEQIGINLIKQHLPGIQVDLAPTPEDHFGRECY